MNLGSVLLLPNLVRDASTKAPGRPHAPASLLDASDARCQVQVQVPCARCQVHMLLYYRIGPSVHPGGGVGIDVAKGTRVLSPSAEKMSVIQVLEQELGDRRERLVLLEQEVTEAQDTGNEAERKRPPSLRASGQLTSLRRLSDFPNRSSKCHMHHMQRWCKIFRAGVNLLLLTYGVLSYFMVFVAFSLNFCVKVPKN